MIPKVLWSKWVILHPFGMFFFYSPELSQLDEVKLWNRGRNFCAFSRFCMLKGTNAGTSQPE
jgi:hypothetical protein